MYLFKLKSYLIHFQPKLANFYCFLGLFRGEVDGFFLSNMAEMLYAKCHDPQTWVCIVKVVVYGCLWLLMGTVRLTVESTYWLWKRAEKLLFFLKDLSHGKKQICIGNAKIEILRTYGTPKINYLVPHVLQNAKKCCGGEICFFPHQKCFFAHFSKTLVLRV